MLIVNPNHQYTPAVAQSHDGYTTRLSEAIVEITDMGVISTYIYHPAPGIAYTGDDILATAYQLAQFFLKSAMARGYAEDFSPISSENIVLIIPQEQSHA